MDVITIIEKILGLVDKSYEVYASAKYNEKLCEILYGRISAGEHRLKILKGNRIKLKEKFKNEDSTKNLIRYLTQVTNLKKNSDSQGEKLNLLIENVSVISKQIDKSNFKNEFSNKVIEGNKLTDPSKDGDIMRKKKKIFDAYLEILRQLNDSNSVIKFYGMSYIDGKDVLVFDWADLGNLKEVYESRSITITWKEKLKIGHDICLGLQFINECHIFHHDVRCENVLIIGPEVTTPKITNFYLSRNIMDKISKKIPSLNDIIPWMAPEKLKSESSYTAKYYEKIRQHIIDDKRESLNFDKSDEIQKPFKKIIYEVWNPKPELRPNMPDILKRLERLYKNYYPKIKPHSKDRTDSDSDDSNDEGDNNFEFEFKKFEISTLEDSIRLFNQDTEESREQAWRCFEYHADTLNNFKAKYYKGLYLLKGYGKVQKDPNKAKELFKEAADDGVTKAQYYYACLIAKEAEEAANNPSLVKECILYLEKAAVNESPDAFFSLGNIYYEGKLNIQQDIKKSIQHYKMAAVNGHSEAIKKLKELNINYLEALLKEKTDWYLYELQSQMELWLGRSICLSTIWRAIHTLGYTCKQLVFSDESAYDRRTLSRHYGWSFLGHRAQKFSFFVRKKRFTIEGALCINGLLAYNIQEGSMNTQDYENFIENVLV
ncbi:31417_t:CDS:2, partial [Gigaspora margarita]